MLEDTPMSGSSPAVVDWDDPKQKDAFAEFDAVQAKYREVDQAKEQLRDCLDSITIDGTPAAFERSRPFTVSQAWNEHVDGLKTKACKALGVKAEKTVKAELHKLLLYEEGAMFKPHTDTEKAEGMFATLVISLPSIHTGGSVVLTHSGKKMEYQTEDHEFVVWFSDVMHEVKPVTSGHRLVLTYNLCQKDTNVHNSALSLLGDTSRLKTILGGLKDNDCWSQMLYMLEHKYTDASLKFDTLKGVDAEKAKCVREVCERLGYTMFLVSVEHKVSDDAHSQYGYYGYPHRITNKSERGVSIKRVIDLGGRELCEDLEIKESAIIQENFFKGREPDDEDYGGWTGNEGAETTYFYHETAIMIVLEDWVAQVIHVENLSSDQIANQLAFYDERRSTCANDAERKKELISLLRSRLVLDFESDNPSLETGEAILLARDRLEPEVILQILVAAKGNIAGVLEQSEEYFSACREAFGQVDLDKFMSALKHELDIGHRTSSAVFGFFRTFEALVLPLSEEGSVITSCRSTFRAACLQHIHFTLEAQPADPGLVRKVVSRDDICEAELNPFLESATEQKKIFNIKASDRDHIKKNLPSYGITQSINKDSVPHRLVLEKTVDTSYTHALKRWEEHHERAARALRRVCTEDFRRLMLGDEYESFMNVDMSIPPIAEMYAQQAAVPATEARIRTVTATPDVFNILDANYPYTLDSEYKTLIQKVAAYKATVAEFEDLGRSVTRLNEKFGRPPSDPTTVTLPLSQLAQNIVDKHRAAASRREALLNTKKRKR